MEKIIITGGSGTVGESFISKILLNTKYIVIQETKGASALKDCFQRLI